MSPLTSTRNSAFMTKRRMVRHDQGFPVIVLSLAYRGNRRMIQSRPRLRAWQEDASGYARSCRARRQFHRSFISAHLGGSIEQPVRRRNTNGHIAASITPLPWRNQQKTARNYEWERRSPADQFGKSATRRRCRRHTSTAALRHSSRPQVSPHTPANGPPRAGTVPSAGGPRPTVFRAGEQYDEPIPGQQQSRRNNDSHPNHARAHIQHSGGAQGSQYPQVPPAQTQVEATSAKILAPKRV